MIKQEKTIINNKELLHTYSDNNKYILQVETNVKYNEAYDVIPVNILIKKLKMK